MKNPEGQSLTTREKIEDKSIPYYTELFIDREMNITMRNNFTRHTLTL